MRISQGTFSFLPELTDEQIRAQIQYGLDNEWAVAIEFTDDPHPRNSYWEMWGMPMFDLKSTEEAVREVNRCREAFPHRYIRVSLYDAKLTRQTIALQFMVNRPAEEPGFRLERQESKDRMVHYTLHSYASERPSGQRYGEGDA
ncbi:MAG: ribulose bisphosphate carboxylase small subunit [Candidatus Dormibacteraeota bacterium]|nr:ribulose bisphosphate carboxylase small subunit [Candidatus Dormibacteraeota bacterium]